jgi:hypothetical protein
MLRFGCLALALAALAAAPGCSSCFGNSCRRPSFMEFRSPCGRNECAAPMAAPCGPVCDPCGPASAPAPCCEGGFSTMPGDMPVGAPISHEPGTFS